MVSEQESAVTLPEGLLYVMPRFSPTALPCVFGHLTPVFVGLALSLSGSELTELLGLVCSSFDSNLGVWGPFFNIFLLLSPFRNFYTACLAVFCGPKSPSGSVHFSSSFFPSASQSE